MRDYFNVSVSYMFQVTHSIMPFYLVTQVTLVEAGDPQCAAQAAVDMLRSGIEVSVAVRQDQTDISHVTIAARSDVGTVTVEPLKQVEPAPLPPMKLNQTTSTHTDDPNMFRKLAAILRIWRPQ